MPRSSAARSSGTTRETLKSSGRTADGQLAAMIDRRLLSHWERERRAREHARASLPETWRRDPRQAMADVRETFVEGMARMRLNSRGSRDL